MRDEEFIQGLDGLLEVLDQLGPNLKKNAMRTATFRAAQDLVPKVKEAAPKGGGTNPKGKKFADKFPIGSLKKLFKATRGRADEEGASAGLKGAFYAKFIEFGHFLRKHGAKKRKKTRIHRGGEIIGHVPANPFILRVFEENKDHLVNVVNDNLVPEIRKQVEKAQSKMGKVK